MSREPALPLSAESIRARARNAGLRPERVIREITINQMHHRLAAGNVEWIVKGGEALVARRVSTRATRDLDVRVSGHDLDAAVVSLRQAVERDAGDGLIYQVSPPSSGPRGLQHRGLPRMHGDRDGPVGRPRLRSL